jgi:hypothetical protein
MARGPIPDKPRDRPTVPEVLPLARRYYETPGNEAGGHLHVVLDDGNLEDTFILNSFDRAFEEGDVDGYVLAANLLAMTRTQRRKLYARFWAQGVTTPTQWFVSDFGAIPTQVRHRTRLRIYIPPASQ